MNIRRRFLRGCCIVLISLGMILSYTGISLADNDVTAPTVESVSFSKAAYDKGASFNMTVNVTETEIGLKYINYCFYAYKDGQMLSFSGSMDITGDKFKDSYVVPVEIPQDVVAAEYYIGQIDVEDQAGNKRIYWNGFEPTGYRIDDNGSYVNDFYKNETKCYVDGGNTITINSTGDDFAPVVTNVTFDSTEISKGGKASLTLDVIEESTITDVFPSFYTYKNNQRYMVDIIDSSFTVSGNKVKYNFQISDEATSGDFYLGQLDIKDNHGNIRMYWDGFKDYGYETDNDGSFIHDFNNENIKMYINNGSTLKIKSNGDDDAPLVSKITIKDATTIKPGIITLTASVSDNVLIKDASVVLYSYKGEEINYLYGSLNNVNIKEGTLEFKIAVPTTTICGEYYVGQFDINDYSGNSRQYWNGYRKEGYDEDKVGSYVPDFFNPETRFYVESGKTVTVEEEFDVAFELALSNPKLLSFINGMTEGETGKIYIDGNTVAKAELFDAIKGKDINLYFYKDNYQWIFNGKDITNAKDIILEISFDKIYGDEYELDQEALKITFADNGELPGKAMVRIKSDYTYQIFQINRDINLYYINQNNELEYEEDSDIRYVLDGTDHWCWFEITHNSSYLATGSKVKQKNRQSDGSSGGGTPNGNTSNDNSSSGNASGGESAGTSEGTGTPSYSSEWVNGYWYNEDGSQTYPGILSWKSDSTGWWVEDTSGWYPVSSWQKIDGYWYYFNASGYMASSEWIGGWWINGDGSCTYDGTASWKSDSTGWYYLDTSGWYPWSQWQKIDGSWYYFDYYGYMVTNKYIDGYWIGADGVCQ